MVRFAVLCVMLASAVARAEDLATYEANGDASAAGADGRVEALDDAFARAASQALDDILTPEQRAAHKADLDREIVGHARLWVAKFTVTKEETNDQRKQLTVSVRVDREKMRARLTELKFLEPVAAPPVSSGHNAALLLRVTTPTGTHATYGASADKEVAGAAAMTSVLRSAGFAAKRVATGDSGALSDAAAEAMAGDAKADVAVVADVVVGGPIPLRGVAAPMSLVTAHVRMIDRATHKITAGESSLAAGSKPELAIDRALAAALADVLPQAAHPIAAPTGFHGDDAPIAEPGVVLVRMSPKTPYALVLAEQKHLQGTKGVSRATLRHIGPSGWVIGVATGEPPDRIAASARKPPATGTSASAKVAGEIVDVVLTGTAP